MKETLNQNKIMRKANMRKVLNKKKFIEKRKIWKILSQNKNRKKQKQNTEPKTEYEKKKKT